MSKCSSAPRNRCSAQLHARLKGDAKGSEQIIKQVTQLEGLVEQKATERSRVVALYRRGRLSDAKLDVQLGQIGKEQVALEAQISELRSRMAGVASIAANVACAQDLLVRLRKRLDEPMPWQIKRRLIEVLVSRIQVDTFEECGVKQTKTTVTYRFSQPEQAMPLVLSQSYSAGVVRIPAEPKTIGDHIRRQRLAEKMLQKDVAARIGVEMSCFRYWEANTSSPEGRYMPAIIEFLGYNPLPPATGRGEELVRQRTTLGLTQKQSAELLAVDQGTLARWERGEREPEGQVLDRVRRFLESKSHRKPDAA